MTILEREQQNCEDTAAMHCKLQGTRVNGIKLKKIFKQLILFWGGPGLVRCNTTMQSFSQLRTATQVTAGSTSSFYSSRTSTCVQLCASAAAVRWIKPICQW